MAVPENNANLRRRGAFPRELADVVDHGFGRGLEPGRHGAGVGDGGGADAFAFAVKTTHLCELLSEDGEMVVDSASVRVRKFVRAQLRWACVGWVQKSWHSVKPPKVSSFDRAGYLRLLQS
jgi:hypothetical protein